MMAELDMVKGFDFLPSHPTNNCETDFTCTLASKTKTKHVSQKQLQKKWWLSLREQLTSKSATKQSYPRSRPPTYLLCPRASGVGTEHKGLLQTAQILAILNLRCYLLSSSASCWRLDAWSIASWTKSWLRLLRLESFPCSSFVAPSISA